MNKAVLISIMAITGAWATAQAADETLNFGYCGDLANYIGTSDASVKTAKAAIQIPQEQAQEWAGASITEINVGYGVSSVKEITVFIAPSLDATPVYMQNATISNFNGWNKIVLDTPYEVKSDAFVVGYSAPLRSTSDKPIGVDNLKNSHEYGAWTHLYDEWENVSKFYGNVCLRLALIGDNLPQYDVQVSGLVLPSVVEVDTPFDAQFTIVNNGLKTLNDIEVVCTVNGKETEPIQINLASARVSGSSTLVNVPGLECSDTGQALPLEVKVTKVDGNPDETPEDNTVSGEFNCALKTYPQNVLVEEFTGTWCGWCPLGIVGMEYMRKNYGDKGFNGIAVHFGDEMAVEPYAAFANSVTGGTAPSAYLNREFFFLEPSAEYLESLFLEASKNPAAANVTLTADYTTADKVLNVHSIAEFSFDENEAEYAMAYVIIEDQVGPYAQTNYFSGGGSGDLPGWSNAASKVPHEFDEVARAIKDVYGIDGSVPEVIKANTGYDYETTLPLDQVKDINKCEVVAMLLDTTDGHVVNSAKTKISIDGTGVEGIESESVPAIYRVYNPQGLKVLETKDVTLLKSLPSGIYIINGKKVML